MTHSDQDLLSELRRDIHDLVSAAESLALSYEKCKNIGIKDHYSFDEEESFDSLSSKFARTSDIFTQKVFKTIFLLLRETPKSFIDKANLAEKLEIIPSADTLIMMRDLRNQIVHEYVASELSRIYKEVLDQYSNLIDAIAATKKNIHERGWK